MLLLMLILFAVPSLQSNNPRFLVERIVDCPGPENKAKLSLVFLNDTSGRFYQYAVANYSYNKPFGPGNRGTLRLDWQSKTTFKHISTIRADDGCEALTLFLGSLWNEFQEGFGLPLNVCPIPPGKYHLSRLKPDWDKVKLNLPPGRIRVTANYTDKVTNERILCQIATIAVPKKRD